MCWQSHWLGWSLSTLGRSLVFSRSRFPPRGSDESLIHSDMVRGLVPSMLRYKGWAILSWWEDWFLPCQIWVLSHSDMTVGLVPTWSYIRSIAILGMELPGEVPGKLNLGLRVVLIWPWDVLSHDQIRVHGHSDVTKGCVPTWLYVRDESILSWLKD